MAFRILFSPPARRSQRAGERFKQGAGQAGRAAKKRGPYGLVGLRVPRHGAIPAGMRFFMAAPRRAKRPVALAGGQWWRAVGKRSCFRIGNSIAHIGGGCNRLCAAGAGRRFYFVPAWHRRAETIGGTAHSLALHPIYGRMSVREIRTTRRKTSKPRENEGCRPCVANLCTGRNHSRFTTQKS